MIQKSLVLMKPDAVKRGIVGEILHRFERAGLKMIGAKLVLPSIDVATKHYPNTDEWKRTAGQHTVDDAEKYGIDLMSNIGTTDPLKVGEMVKQWNIGFLTSGPVLAIVFEGLNAIERIRTIVGNTVPAKAAPGTIRGDFSLESATSANRRKRTIFNLVHASGTVDEADFEISLWFKPEELLSYKLVQEDFYQY